MTVPNLLHTAPRIDAMGGIGSNRCSRRPRRVAWERERNVAAVRVNGRLSIGRAREQLHGVYPEIQKRRRRSLGRP